MTAHTVQTLLDALRLPQQARLEQRIPKKLLLENSAATAADKRLLNDAIEEIRWLAALKPHTIGIPAYHDAIREYLEIAVLAVTLRSDLTPARQTRLAALIHRAIPYPLFLLLAGQTPTLSLAHKRRAQNETDKTVLDGEPLSITPSGTDNAIADAFYQSLALGQRPQTSLYALYQGWITCLEALQVAHRSGNYRLASTAEQADARRAALAACVRLEEDIRRLRAQADKEKQLARLVAINQELKQLQAALAAAQQQL